MNNKNKYIPYNPEFDYKKDFSHIDIFSAWIGHQQFAYDFVRNIKPKIIVELGTHNGSSFFSMCQAAKDEKITSQLYAIDNWKGDTQAGFYDKTVFNEVKEIVNKIYPLQKITLLKKTFDDALSNFNNETIDLLHIDGLHTYEAVKHDFENWLPKVKKNGTIMLHDIYEKKEDFGVYKLWDELKKKYETIEFNYFHGLGVIFLRPTKKDTYCFSEIYTKYYENINNLNTKITEHNQLKQEKEKLSLEHNQLKQEKEKLQSENQNLTKQIKEVNQIVSKYQSTYEENLVLNERIQALNINIQDIQQSLAVIRSSKFFKTWQMFNKFKKSL